MPAAMSWLVFGIGGFVRAKIVQIECRASSLLGRYAEMQPIFCKDIARREENEMNVFISYPEP